MQIRFSAEAGKFGCLNQRTLHHLQFNLIRFGHKTKGNVLKDGFMMSGMDIPDHKEPTLCLS